MKNMRNVCIVPRDRYKSVLLKHELQALYSAEAPLSYKQDVLQGLGPLKHVFTLFLEHEQQLAPLATSELTALFDRCSDQTSSAAELLDVLYQLAPGNGRIGYQQVNILTDHLRKR